MMIRNIRDRSRPGLNDVIVINAVVPRIPPLARLFGICHRETERSDARARTAVGRLLDVGLARRLRPRHRSGDSMPVVISQIHAGRVGMSRRATVSLRETRFAGG